MGHKSKDDHNLDHKDDIPTSKGTETVWSKDADDLDTMDSVVVCETGVRGAAVWLLVQARCL